MQTVVYGILSIPLFFIAISAIIQVPLDFYIMWGTTIEASNNLKDEWVSGVGLVMHGFTNVSGMFIIGSIIMMLDYVVWDPHYEQLILACGITWTIMEAMSTVANLAFHGYV